MVNSKFKLGTKIVTFFKNLHKILRWNIFYFSYICYHDLIRPSSLTELQIDKLSGNDQIFQVWPYLNSLIIIKLPFSQQEHVQTFPLLSPSNTYALPFDFALERDLKNISYYQRDIENYMDQVLNFFVIQKTWIYKHRISRSVILVSILMLQVYLTFSLFFKIWLTESILISRE